MKNVDPLAKPRVRLQAAVTLRLIEAYYRTVKLKLNIFFKMGVDVFIKLVLDQPVQTSQTVLDTGA